MNAAPTHPLTSAAPGATIVAMTTEPLRSVRDHLSELVDRVESEHDRVVITRNGREAAVLISAEDLAELEETLSGAERPRGPRGHPRGRCRICSRGGRTRHRRRATPSFVTSSDEYELIVTPPAGRALSDQLPEPVAAAVIEFLTTTLVREPVRVGKPLRGELAGIWSARRGTYRILYRVREDPREVIVLRIEHRRDVYRPR